MNYKKLKATLVEAKKMGLGSVKLTGGEPFLYSHILDLLMWLKESSIGVFIETNGTFLGKKETSLMKESGVYQVAVSLNGSCDRIHEKMSGLKGSFKNTVDGVKRVVKAGVNVQIIFSIWKGNEGDLKKTVRLAKELGVKSFKINLIGSVCRAISMEKKGELLSMEEILALRKDISGLNRKLDFNIVLDIPCAFLPPGQIKKNPVVCNIKRIVGILPDGSLSICGIGANVEELIMGNIDRDSITDIWNENKILAVIRRDIPDKLEGICGKCIFKYLCMGKCRAIGYRDKKSLFSPFRFCQEAYEKGLFPGAVICEN